MYYDCFCNYACITIVFNVGLPDNPTLFLMTDDEKRLNRERVNGWRRRHRDEYNAYMRAYRGREKARKEAGLVAAKASVG